MRRLSAALAALGFASVIVSEGRSATNDILMVVLEPSGGKKELHHQVIPSERCGSFLKRLAQHKQQGRPVTLTFEAPPPATGLVIDAYCVMPDGRAMRYDGTFFRP